TVFSLGRASRLENVKMLRDCRAAVPVCQGTMIRAEPREMEHPFTLGVEEEFQIVDPETWQLQSHVSELLASSAATFGDQFKRELHQSIVEVGTTICWNVADLGGGILGLRRVAS